MAVYPALAVLAAALVVALELCVLRTGVFRQPAYWIAMAIVFAFMIPVDGWLTKLSAPIVIYRDADTSGWRPVWDILGEYEAFTDCNTPEGFTGGTFSSTVELYPSYRED